MKVLNNFTRCLYFCHHQRIFLSHTPECMDYRNSNNTCSLKMRLCPNYKNKNKRGMWAGLGGEVRNKDGSDCDHKKKVCNKPNAV